MKIILYSIDCPKFEILKDRLKEKGVDYEVCNDIKLMISKGFRSMPILEVDKKFMTYLEAINWTKEI
jgi:hypothetical protein